MAKTKALVAVKVENRLQHHALCEAVLHQIDATFLALVRQVGDAHGLKPEHIGSLDDLIAQLVQRDLVSLEVQRMHTLVTDPEGGARFNTLRQVSCPDDASGTADTDRIPLTDTLGVDRLKNARYSEWVEELRFSGRVPGKVR